MKKVSILNRINLLALTAFSAIPAFCADPPPAPSFPDPLTYVSTVETVGTAAAVVGGAILVYVIGKNLVSKFVK